VCHRRQLGITTRIPARYHRQTCGKVERFHQTLKKHLATRPGADSCEAMQEQIDRFVAYYNDVRPHPARPPEAVGAACLSTTWEPSGAPVTSNANRHRVSPASDGPVSKSSGATSRQWCS
jgi:transposase InsO family protein